MQETEHSVEFPERRDAPLGMSPEEFRAAGHALVDQLTEFLASLQDRPVTAGESPEQIWNKLPAGPIPEEGSEPASLLPETAQLLIDHSLFNGHPRFWGYITSSPAPIGMLADFLASTMNGNVGAWVLSPMASTIETQTIRWIAEFMGYPVESGGLLVSGGNMANFVAFIAARRAKLHDDIRETGLTGLAGTPRVYVSTETHTWIEKAADISGMGTGAIRWIPVDTEQRMRPDLLQQQIAADRRAGDLPFMVIGNAGTVSTGAVDPLPDLAAIANENDLWFHVDGAYGGLAARADGAPSDLAALDVADSVAVDPHKWLYSPIEAGCTLVRNADHLSDAFSFHPPYYHFDGHGKSAINYLEYGPQNTRGFRALKVWLAFRQAGRTGHLKMIADDIKLANYLFELADSHPALEACTRNLSIATFRYMPEDLDATQDETYLNELNAALLDRLQKSGEMFISNAMLDGMYVLRACIVNFHTTRQDIEALPEIVVRHGKELDSTLRPATLRKQPAD